MSKNLELLNKYKDYIFKYTYEDVNYFNKVIFDIYGFKPFTPTTPKKSNYMDISIKRNDLLRYWDYASLAYNDDNFQINHSVLESIGNSQVRITREDGGIVIAFRGSQTDFFNNTIDSLGDWSNNIETLPKLISSLNWVGVNDSNDGLIHSGFNKYVDRLYDLILNKYILVDTTKSITIVGHSLGAISSLIFAYRLLLETKYRNIKINIKKVYCFGSPKGLFIPSNYLTNEIEVLNIFNKYDVVSYANPIYGDHIGTKIILDNNDYEIFYRDQLTPYLAISIGNSLELFNNLKKDINYIPLGWSYFQNLIKPLQHIDNHIYSNLPSFFNNFLEGLNLGFLGKIDNALEDGIVGDKYLDNLNIYNSYLVSFTSFESVSIIELHTNYKEYIKNIDENFIMNYNNLEYIKLQDRVRPDYLYFDSGYFTKTPLKDNKYHNLNRHYKTKENIPRILGYIINYKKDMEFSKILI